MVGPRSFEVLTEAALKNDREFWIAVPDIDFRGARA
jgi:hypothetical protein